MKSHCLLTALILIPFLSFAQENPEPKTAEHPFFKAAAGKWIEEGVVVPNANSQPIEGKAVSVTAPVLDGIWVQQDGMAEYGPIRWKYRWMFRVKILDGKEQIYALYIDSMGQQIQYFGNYDADAKRIQLVGKLPDGGEGRSQVTIQDNGTLLIQSVLVNPQGETGVRYQAEARRPKEE
ncbi:MAG: DUF1579 family protein [Verrucomicrobiales bacterium]|nr:DUF1579 family protein [Verrucomicrobiales bacterium]